jgi:hypothetical protein
MKRNGKTALGAKSKRALAKKDPKAKKQLVTVMGPLSAGSLRDVLWETLNDVRTNQMLPNRADAIASQAREILRTVKTQLQIASAARRGVPEDIIEFSEK